MTTIPPPGSRSRLRALGPDAARVAEVDATLRKRLGQSIRYIAEVAEQRGAIVLDGIEDLERHLAAGPVSPFVYCLYSKLVAELSSGADAQTVTNTFADMVSAAAAPASPGLVPFGDETVPASWWDHYRTLLDTDRARPFRPLAPGDAYLDNFRKEAEATLDLFAASDPDFYAELTSLLRMIVPASPDADTESFNGASTFFVWGGALFNAEPTRSKLQMLDVLVHECSHVLLFGLSAEGPLTTNSGEERYTSPVREDPRPIDGIFHAAFVTTRVHLAMNRLLDAGVLGSEDEAQAIERRRYNGEAAREALDLLEQHAVLTPNGEDVLGELRAYWEADGAPKDSPHKSS